MVEPVGNRSRLFHLWKSDSRVFHLIKGPLVAENRGVAIASDGDIRNHQEPNVSFQAAALRVVIRLLAAAALYALAMRGFHGAIP